MKNKNKFIIGDRVKNIGYDEKPYNALNQEGFIIGIESTDDYNDISYVVRFDPPFNKGHTGEGLSDRPNCLYLYEKQLQLLMSKEQLDEAKKFYGEESQFVKKTISGKIKINTAKELYPDADIFELGLKDIEYTKSPNAEIAIKLGKLYKELVDEIDTPHVALSNRYYEILKQIKELENEKD